MIGHCINLEGDFFEWTLATNGTLTASNKVKCIICNQLSPESLDIPSYSTI